MYIHVYTISRPTKITISRPTEISYNIKLFYKESMLKSGCTIANIGILHNWGSFTDVDPSPSSSSTFTILPRLNGTAGKERYDNPDKHEGQVYQCADPRGNLERGIGMNTCTGQGSL